MAPNELDVASAYLMRRLSLARQAEVPASMQFDMARSPMSDEELESAVDSFRSSPRAEGWGFAPIFQELLSREPDKVKVNDLVELQEKMQAQGYLSPDYKATGVWDATSNAALRRLDRDAREEQMRGHNAQAAPVEAGLRLITNTLPSRVWQGLVGTAKGLMEQTGETFERGGALGGAAVGGGIGAALGSVVPGIGTAIGAGAGAAIGGIGGFLADLFGEEEEGEQDPSQWGTLLDALTPFEEYSTNPKAFFEDLGYMASAASLIAGAGMAYKGANLAIGTARGISTETGAPLMQSLISRAGPAEPGWMTRITAAATKPVLGSNRVERMVDWVKSYGLNAQTSRPIFQAVNKPYGGLAAGTIGARMAAGAMSGPGELTTIEAAIAGTDPLPDYVDMLGIMLYPEQLLPFKAKQAAGAATRLMGNTDMLPFAHVIQKERNLPLRQAVQVAKETLGKDAFEQSITSTWLRYQFGLDMKAAQKVHELGRTTPGVTSEGTFASARFDTIQKLQTGSKMTVDEFWKETNGTIDIPVEWLKRRAKNATPRTRADLDVRHGFGEVEASMRKRGWDRDEPLSMAYDYKTGELEIIDATHRFRLAQDLGMETVPVSIIGNADRSNIYKWVEKNFPEAVKVNTGELSKELLEWSFKDPAHFEAWLQDRTMGRLPDYLKAEKTVHKIRRDIRSGKIEIAPDQVRGFLADPEAGWERLKTHRMIEGLKADAEKITKQLKTTTDPTAVATMKAQVAQHEAAIGKLRESMPKGKGEPRTLENLVITPERLDTPTTGDLGNLKDEFTRLRTALVDAVKKGEYSQAQIARVEFQTFVEDLAYKGIVPHKLVEKATAAERPSWAIREHLEKRAKYAASDITLPGPAMEELAALGYKPVVTSNNVVMTSDVAKLGEVMGAGDYTRRAALFETLGLSPRWRSDEGLFALRNSNEVAELDQVMATSGLKLTGKQVQSKLYDRLAEISHDSITFGPVSQSKVKRKPHLPMIDVRDLKPDDITLVFDDVAGWTDELSMSVHGALRRGAAYGSDTKLMHPTDTMRALGRALRLNGLPGFSDVMRAYRIENPNKLALGTTIAGGVLGGVHGDDPFEDAVRGALGGAALGAAGRGLAKRAYGYLPDQLHKVNTALRYTFSITFDAGRYSEQNLIAATKYGLPGMLSPKRHISARRWKTPYGGEVTGDDAWRHTVQFWDELNGTPGFFKNIEDSDRRVYQAGLLGFKPRDWEAAQAFQLYQRGWSREKIKEAVTQIGRYGLGRTSVEKSANFIFFPFSFSKKLLTTLGDFLLQAPARALLLHEGMRRYHESSLDEGFHEFIEKHAPLLEKLANVNNLYYGLSPGRFFLEGISDQRTDTAKVMQTLASVFVPSGAATPLAAAAGQVGDWSVNAFVPIVVTGESLSRAGGIEGLQDIITRYVPLVRDVQQYADSVGEQVVALREGAAPDYQFQRYVDGKREAKAELEPLALGMGYASVDGLLASDIGMPFQARLEAETRQLQEENPTGFRMASQFEDNSSIDAQALHQMSQKEDKSPAEERILNIFEEIEGWRFVSDFTGLDSQLSHAILSKKVREIGERYAGDGRFVELWERFLAWEYGPLRRIA